MNARIKCGTKNSTASEERIRKASALLQCAVPANVWVFIAGKEKAAKECICR